MVMYIDIKGVDITSLSTDRQLLKEDKLYSYFNKNILNEIRTSDSYSILHMNYHLLNSHSFHS